jgi:hypothetical protein
VSLFVTYISQFLPIFLGVGIMLLFRSINLKRNSIRIEFPDRFNPIETADLPQKEALRSTFEREARESLIVGGFFNKQARTGELSRIAFSKLGIVELDEFDKVSEYGCVPEDKYLTVVAENAAEFTQKLENFDYVSGILLAYMVNYRLNIMINRGQA